MLETGLMPFTTSILLALLLNLPLKFLNSLPSAEIFHFNFVGRNLTCLGIEASLHHLEMKVEILL